ncbi:hypothetical protein G3I40_05335 [Streptomyces sp. SID14478]|uniref:hypothetical protein n=1 Tax=Streptomyces sp. SID14478 TaxID=2706073 RepID=UPI0013D9816D|nr:hypothetical protein [Streptomyces sp. SID14478]NEB74657.1 hypothetical protein [Streptomyces sp. SID14478]
MARAHADPYLTHPRGQLIQPCPEFEDGPAVGHPGLVLRAVQDSVPDSPAMAEEKERAVALGSDMASYAAPVTRVKCS